MMILSRETWEATLYPFKKRKDGEDRLLIGKKRDRCKEKYFC